MFDPFKESQARSWGSALLEESFPVKSTRPLLHPHPHGGMGVGEDKSSSIGLLKLGRANGGVRHSGSGAIRQTWDGKGLSGPGGAGVKRAGASGGQRLEEIGLQGRAASG